MAVSSTLASSADPARTNRKWKKRPGRPSTSRGKAKLAISVTTNNVFVSLEILFQNLGKNDGEERTWTQWSRDATTEAWWRPTRSWRSWRPPSANGSPSPTSCRCRWPTPASRRATCSSRRTSSAAASAYVHRQFLSNSWLANYNPNERKCIGNRLFPDRTL